MAWEGADVAVTNAGASSLLGAFAAAALALPGLCPEARAELSPEDLSIDTNFSRYAESNGRMKVDVYQAAANLVVNDKLSLRLHGVKDVITGASPIGIGRVNAGNCKGPSLGDLRQCLSSASISDVRDAIDINATYALDKATLDLDVGRSSENDYESNFFNLSSRWDFDNKMTTLTAGYGYASDQVWEIQAINGVKVRTSQNGGDKETNQGMLGLTRILDKDSLIQANVTYAYNAGYLTDPYKYVYDPVAFFSQPYPQWVHERRPSNRNQVGLLLNYVRNFEELNAASLHADYRFYADSWGLDSHTFELSWLQPVWGGWMLTPRARYYSQNSADFYQLIVTGQPSAFLSSDYRLAGFGAIGGGMHISRMFFDRLKVSGGVDFYQRERAWGFSGGGGTALDNFSFSMFSVSLNLKF